jgi:hypothetical protein
VRTSGMSIVLTSHAEGIPPVLSQLVRQVKALSETVLLVTVRVLHQPHVADVSPLTDLGHGFYRLVMTCGYMDEPNVPRAVALAIERDSLRFDIEQATYFVARDTFMATSAGRMGRISEGVLRATSPRSQHKLAAAKWVFLSATSPGRRDRRTARLVATAATNAAPSPESNRFRRHFSFTEPRSQLFNSLVVPLAISAAGTYRRRGGGHPPSEEGGVRGEHG